MTHHHATFLALATDGADAFGGISESAEVSVLGRALTLAGIASLIRNEVSCSVLGDFPLVVIISKNKPRATAGEVFLEAFALAIVRDALAKMPEEILIDVCGEKHFITSTYYKPRVASTPLPWATKSTDLTTRMHSLLVDLSTTDSGLDFIPKGRSHVGA